MIRRLFFLAGLGALLSLLATRAHGAAPVGAFLNGAFPATTPGPSGAWSLEQAFPNLTFVDPVRMVKDPLGPDHVYVVCRSGEVWRVPFRANATTAEKVRVLDRRANTFGWWDAGMVGLAFHPDFGVPGDPDRGYVYVFYQYLPVKPATLAVNTPSYMRLSRFTVPDGATAFDPASEQVLIQQYDRHNWHNGGQMFFGPDRFLHLVVGDEGDANDSFGVAQRINHRLFSGILRIDVDRDPSRSHPIRRQPVQISMPAGWEPSFTQGYFIPNDNPWQDPSGGTLEEYWSVGTRSPHSMHFDAASGNIWIAEVGQGTREEITLARKGGNHQWPYKEGLANGPKAKPSPLIGIENPPIYDYPRSMGGCIIGGIVYRGSAHSAVLTGKYLFGDHNTKALYSLQRKDDGTVQVDYLTSVFRSGGDKRGLAGICEGPDGEAYFMELGDAGTDTGKIYRLVRTGVPVAEPPALLSQTGAFASLSPLVPAAGLTAYQVNSPLWSDGAAKQRWIAIPNNGTHDTAAEQVTFRPSGAWSFPPGTVMVKHFALPVDERDPTRLRPIETRFLVNGADGKYYGVTYRWNAAGTDATLLTTDATVDLEVTLAGGGTRSQSWTIPSRADCLTCHNTNAGGVLGLRSHQLNGGGQLESWAALGIFGHSFDGQNPANLPRSVAIDDPRASLDHRVRSYLDANCSHCHQPGGVSANFDASFATPLSSQGLIDGLINRPVADPDVRVISPGDLARSLLHTRVNATGPIQMPPLGKNVVDAKAAAAIADWILSLAPAEFQFDANPTATPVVTNDAGNAAHGQRTLLNVLTNDSDADAPLGIHGVAITTPPQHGSLKILGAEKRLAYVHDATANWRDSFSYTVTDPQGRTSAPARVDLTIPQDFAAWTTVTPGASGAAAADLDGDELPELLEFALGLVPDRGDNLAGRLQLVVTPELALQLKRPVALAGLGYVVETSPDRITWTPMSPTSVAAGEPETLTFASLGSRPGVSPDAGFVRLRVTSGAGEAISPPLGWQAVSFGAGSRTVGIPFRETPVFGSVVDSMAGGVLTVRGTPELPVDFAGYIEVLDGSYAGHRFELDRSRLTTGRLAIDGASPRNTMTLPPDLDLSGARISLSPHHRLGAIFPKDSFQGSTNPSAADQIQFYRNDGSGPPGFELYYLLDARPGNAVHQWRAFLPGSGDQGGRIIAPGEGMIVKRPGGSGSSRILLSGQVRSHPFAQPLRAGVNLVGLPFIAPMSPRQRGLVGGAFHASTDLAQADQFHLLESQAFRIFYLLDHPTQTDPWREAAAGGTNFNDVPLFAPDRATFFRLKAGLPAYRISPPSPIPPES